TVLSVQIQALQQSTNTLQQSMTTLQATVDALLNVIALQQPVPVHFGATCSTSALGCAGQYTVPTAKRLVIEYVSLNAFGLPAGVPVGMTIQTRVGGQLVVHQIPTTGIAANGQSQLGQAVRLYADPGETVQMTGLRFGQSSGGGPSTTYNFSFSGHLLPVP